MAKPRVLPPIRCDDIELMRWRAAATWSGLTLSEWVRRELTQAADYILSKAPPRRT